MQNEGEAQIGRRDKEGERGEFKECQWHKESDIDYCNITIEDTINHQVSR